MHNNKYVRLQKHLRTRDPLWYREVSGVRDRRLRRVGVSIQTPKPFKSTLHHSVLLFFSFIFPSLKKRIDRVYVFDEGVEFIEDRYKQTRLRSTCSLVPPTYLSGLSSQNDTVRKTESVDLFRLRPLTLKLYVREEMTGDLTLSKTRNREPSQRKEEKQVTKMRRFISFLQSHERPSCTSSGLNESQ